ncbi:MAG TPA: hypothetical protein PLF88_02610 [Opitutaceae bacterium]|nr:hypothetical protein [Opitutaceae bacterium]HRJ47479.1 hypothetical protein [Opitutaceae bacterium]
MIPRPTKLRAVPSILFVLAAGGWIGPALAAAPADAEIARHFQERREKLIQTAIAIFEPADATQGTFLDVAAALQRGENLAAAQARLNVLNEPRPTGNMFWMYPVMAVLLNGEAHLDAGNRARLAHWWRHYWPSRGDTENHWVMYYASLYLAAQHYAGTGPEHWFNGQSAAENLTEARGYLEHWMQVTTTVGQGEYDSPGYIGEYVVPLALLVGWAEDAALRQKARMMLDYIFFDYVVEQLNGQYAGAHSRVYPRQLLQPARVTASALGWLLFGLGDYQQNAQSLLLALSGYAPPPILERIARDTSARPYVNREFKRTRWRMRHAGADSMVVGDKRTLPVYKYSHVDRDFVLGSSQGGLLQPIQQQTWNLRWRVDEPLDASNTFFAVQPYSSPHEGTMYFGADWDTVTDLIARSKTDYDSPDKLASGSPHEQVFQHGPALIGLYDIPADTRFPHVTTLFSRDTEDLVEDESGWIFARGGPVYFAYRPLVPGEWKPNDWTGLLGGGAGGWISTGFLEWGSGHRCYVSTARHNGYVVQVAPARDFDSYAAFQAAVRALPLTFSTATVAEVTFTALDGSVLRARYGEVPSVNGEPLDYAGWPLFESPFGVADRGSRRLEIRHGAERYRLDFENNVIMQTFAQP